MLHVDVMICFFNFFDIRAHRYEVTAKNFKHMANIRNLMKDKARVTFTIVGSEKEQSHTLYTEHFNDALGDTYIEFDQNNNVPCGYGNNSEQRNFFEMLTRKINTGMRHSTQKNPDISLWQGSNDFVESEFFIQIVDRYNADVPQFYGVQKFNTGNTCVCFYLYGENERIWWDGNQNFGERSRYKSVPCIVGINRCVFTDHPKIVQEWSCDEGDNEEKTLKIPNAEFVGASNILVISPKMSSSMDVTSFTDIRYLIRNNIINYENLPLATKNKIEDFFDYFHVL